MAEEIPLDSIDDKIICVIFMRVLFILKAFKMSQQLFVIESNENRTLSLKRRQDRKKKFRLNLLTNRKNRKIIVGVYCLSNTLPIPHAGFKIKTLVIARLDEPDALPL